MATSLSSLITPTVKNLFDGAQALMASLRTCWTNGMPQIQPQPQPRQIEDYPLGYPRLAAFFSSNHSFSVARRFRTLHARIILLQQARLADLEAQLAKEDEAEEVRLFLSSQKQDGNKQRLAIIQEARTGLQEYEAVITSYRKMSMLPIPTALNLQSTINWMHNNKPVVRPEAGMFDDKNDLVALEMNEDHGPGDETVEWVLEKCFPSKFTALSTRNHTRDAYSHLDSPARVEQFSRLITTLAVVTLLFLPMILLYNLQSDRSRFLCILFSVMMFTAVLAIFTRARKAEIFGAAAAYGAVLVVYIAPLP